MLHSNVRFQPSSCRPRAPKQILRRTHDSDRVITLLHHHTADCSSSSPTADPSPSGEYLRNITTFNGDVDEINGGGNSNQQHEYDDYDDAYDNSVLPTARSVPDPDGENPGPPVGEEGGGDGEIDLSSLPPTAEAMLPPNEEPPIPLEGEYLANGDPIPHLYDVAVKTSKFEDLEPESPAAREAEPQSSSSSVAADDSGTEKESEQGDAAGGKGIKKVLQNFLGRNDDAKTQEERERARKWSEWMVSGRKVRSMEAIGEAAPTTLSEQLAPSDGAADQTQSASSSPSPDVSLDESLLSSLDKGSEYVVVAVPADAVGSDVGPVLPAFPGGKLFQKTIGKAFQDLVDGGGGGGAGTNSTVSAGGPAVPAKNEKKKPKKSQSSKKKGKKPDKKREESKEDIERKQKRRQQRHYRERQKRGIAREPGRISASDWRHNMHNLPSSTILRDVGNPVACVFAWATFYSVLYKWLTRVVKAATVAASSGGAGGAVVIGSGATSLTLSSRWVGIAAWAARHMCMPTVQHTMMVSAMSLLLVFRTNSAYQRFAEGRYVSFH